MPDGKSVTNIGLATNEEWKDKNGDKQGRAEFHNLTFFGKLADIAGKYLTKGSQVFVEGTIRTDKWQDKETGKDRFATKIIVNELTLLSGKGSKEEPEAKTESKAPIDEFDDDVGF